MQSAPLGQGADGEHAIEQNIGPPATSSRHLSPALQSASCWHGEQYEPVGGAAPSPASLAAEPSGGPSVRASRASPASTPAVASPPPSPAPASCSTDASPWPPVPSSPASASTPPLEPQPATETATTARAKAHLVSWITVAPHLPQCGSCGQLVRCPVHRKSA